MRLGVEPNGRRCTIPLHHPPGCIDDQDSDDGPDRGAREDAEPLRGLDGFAAPDTRGKNKWDGDRAGRDTCAVPRNVDEILIRKVGEEQGDGVLEKDKDNLRRGEAAGEILFSRRHEGKMIQAKDMASECWRSG